MRNWEAFERIGRMLEAQRWIFAKTRAKINPHHYTLKREWDDPDAFDWAVQFIADHGYKKWFGRRPYLQLNVNERFYWAMSEAGVAELINVKPRGKQSNDDPPYDAVADVYDEMYSDPESLNQNRLLFERLGDLSGLSVLDVGCGTGLLLDHPGIGPSYLGIDPSGKMLHYLKERHPDRNVLRTELGAFVGARYDLVVALFGVGNYLTEDELRRIPLLLRPGGRFFVMFGVDGYRPKITGVIDNRGYRSGCHEAWLPGSEERFDDTYVIVTGSA